jgi:protein-tyrosine phosphatase
LEELQELLKRIPDGPVLVHCAQGHGRTGTIAIAILADRLLISSLEEGLQVVQAVRPGIKLNARQKSLLQKYFYGLASNNKNDGTQQAAPVL